MRRNESLHGVVFSRGSYMNMNEYLHGGVCPSHRFVFAWVDLEFAWHGDGVFAWKLHGEHSLLKGAVSLVVSLSSWWVLSGLEPWSWRWEYPSLVLFLHSRFGRRTRKKGLLLIKKTIWKRKYLAKKGVGQDPFRLLGINTDPSHFYVGVFAWRTTCRPVWFEQNHKQTLLAQGDCWILALRPLLLTGPFSLNKD